MMATPTRFTRRLALGALASAALLVGVPAMAEGQMVDVRIVNRGNIACLVQQPLPVFEPAQFLERVDRYLAVGTDCDPAAGEQEGDGGGCP